MKKLSFFLLTLLLFLHLHATVSFDDLAGAVCTFWNDSNGLPSNTLLNIIQDDIGYIWLASYDGLIRFDGLTFTEFTKKDHGFTGASPRVLHKGKDGSIWIGTNTSGLYNYKNHKFIHYGQDSGLPDISIRAINIDERGRLYVGTANGIAYLGDNGQFIPLGTEVNTVVGVISFLLPVKNTLWVGSNKKGIKVIKDGKIDDLPYLEEIADETFSTGYLDFDGSIWLGTLSGKMFKIKNEQITTYDFENMKSASINAFLRLKSGTMFVASYKGLGRFSNENFDLFSEKKGLPDKLVSALCQDKEGNLWLAMKNAGVGKFSKGKFLDITRASFLPPESMHSVLEDKSGNIWSTSDNGVTCLKDDKLSSKENSKINKILEKLKNVRVRQIREDADGTLFFATYSNDGLVILKPDGSIKTIAEKDGLQINRVRFSYRDSTDILWIGTTAGVAYYVNGTVTKIPDEVLPNSVILSIFRDHNGTLWVGTDGGGVAKFKIEDGDNGNLKVSAQHVFNTENGLDGNIVFRITEDENENLWFSTSTGLTLYKGGIFYSADQALGTESEQVFNFIPDTQGNAWIIKPKELSWVSLESFTQAVQEERLLKNIISYNKLDGITGQMVANSWPCLTKSNRLFIPTSKGISLRDPNHSTANSLPPPVVIENIIVDNRVFDAMTGKLTVPANAKRISFKFTALSYTVPERVRFDYMLEGYDSHWLSSGTAREIGYTNLRPGNYVFKVRAVNNDGIINENGFNVSFYKEPFFYQTIWFYILLPLLIAVIVFAGVQLKLRSLQIKAKELDQKVKEKTYELAQEKEKSDSLLKNILPTPIIEELITTGKAKPRLYSSVSILFADLVSFTKWAGENSSEVVISKLNAIFSRFDEIMDKYGCERIKTLGDGYMACCGLRGEKNHAGRLVDAATEMLKTLEEVNNNTSSSFQIKIAIDSGAVTGGIVGEHKYIFDIFGDAVNTTFRLQAITAPMACTISEKTAALLDGRYSLYKRPKRELKGKGMCESYYLVYKNESIKGGVNVQNEWNALCKAFMNKDYKLMKQILPRLDSTLLEPEKASKIYIIKKMLAKSHAL